MANPPRIRKRVNAVRRAADGSAFEDCHFCGVRVAVALFDMHDCGAEKGMKRFKGVVQIERKIGKVKSFADQPRSPFRIFMECFSKDYDTIDLIEVDRKGFLAWTNMSDEQRKPYVVKAKLVDARCEMAMLEEIKRMPRVDDEAMSARALKSCQIHSKSPFKNPISCHFCLKIQNSDHLISNPKAKVTHSIPSQSHEYLLEDSESDHHHGYWNSGSMDMYTNSWLLLSSS